MSLLPDNYHIPLVASVAGLAIAASVSALSGSSSSTKKRKRRPKKYVEKDYDKAHVLGLINTGNSCFLNSTLQALASLPSLYSYLSERVDPDEDDPDVPRTRKDTKKELSVTEALFNTVEALNEPLMKPKSMNPREIVEALERKIGGVISREQQDAHELYQIISSCLTSEQEHLFHAPPSSLLDPHIVRLMAKENAMEKSDIASVSSMQTSYSTFSLTSTAGVRWHRTRRPKNPFTGLAASRVSCVKCGYTAAIRHQTFDNISLTVPRQTSTSVFDLLKTYTKIDFLNDFQCRKCTLINTIDSHQKRLERLRKRLAKTDGIDSVADLEIETRRIEDELHRLESALKEDVERSLSGITLHPLTPSSQTTKQTMIAQPPRSLCLHLSRSIYLPTHQKFKNPCAIAFEETLDLSPYVTTGILNLGARSSISVLCQKPDERCIPYRLQAVVAHGGGHDQGHFVAYRRRAKWGEQPVTPSLQRLTIGRAGPVDEMGEGLLGVLPSLGRRTMSRRSSFIERPRENREQRWWRISDEDVSECMVEEVLEAQEEVYMLFYEREM